MRWIYGKQDWALRERGQENCYLVTNGLGGFSSATMIGSVTRNDHSFFMAAVEAPNHRYNMIHRLEEYLEWDSGEKNVISSQEYVEPEKNENGQFYLSSFEFEDYPRWVYHVNGLEIVKEIAMKQGENTVAVRYLLDNRTRDAVWLSVVPHMQFTKKGERLMRTQEFFLRDRCVSSAGLKLYFDTDGVCEAFLGQFVEGLYYAYDACDGRDCKGNTYIAHRIRKRAAAGACVSLEIVYRLEEKTGPKGEGTGAAEIFDGAAAYRKNLAKASGFRHRTARLLAKSANQFVAERASVNGKTILAGFPFFEDWGRDTMIALGGCCIATRQTETAERILRTFASYCRKGLMPNLFPEGENEPQYNTADAALLFINAVYLCYEKTKNSSFVQEMWPVMCGIIEWYRRGTSHGIHMDEDGLIMAGEGQDQVTWMDVRIGEILPTPRHGKPVEINACWYNALRILEKFGNLFGEKNTYGKLAEKVRQSFCEKFWNDEKGCLKDVLSGTAADNQVRCNQIWAVSMPFTMLDEKRERQVVDIVFEKLYTPYGLRTLEAADAAFCAKYGGPQLKRDLAYHQGTVWVFPLGAYYLAYLKTRGYSQDALHTVERELSAIEGALREGCIGQLPEIYDGDNPSFSRGCFAQAWSVGEILRVYEAMEEHKSAGCRNRDTKQYEIPGQDMEGNAAYAAVAQKIARYRNVIFDLYGTLVDIHTDEEKREAWENMAVFFGEHGAGYGPDELFSAYRKAVREEQGRVCEIDIETVFGRLYGAKGVLAGRELVRSTCQRFRELTTEYIRLYDGAVALLKTLKRRGKRIYLLSNAQRAFTEREMRQLGIWDCFDAVFLSSDYGVKKPDKAFFDILLKETGIRPGESMMVGNDMSCDVEGAKRAGISAFYIHSALSSEYAEWKADDGCDMEEKYRCTDRKNL